jgi:GT2 family glycosyltransferase
MTELSIALLNYNGQDHLKTYLPSVVKFSEPYPIILIDNGSEDQSVSWVLENFPTVEIICFEENYGFCGGYNKALQLIDSEYVVLLNTDVRVTENWISPVLDYLKAKPQIKAAQPKILDDKRPEYFEYAGGAGGYLDQLAYPFCRGRIFETLEKDQGQYNDNRLVSWASGSCLFVDRAYYLELGGLDERFFAHMEEIDLCWRIWNTGYQVGFCGASNVYHLGGGTLNKANARKTYLNFRNGLSILMKNEPSSSLFWKIPLRIVMDWLAIIKFSIQSGPKHGFAIIRAHLAFLTEISSNLQQRVDRTNSKRIYYKKLLAWEYFVLKRKKFNYLRGEDFN